MKNSANEIPESRTPTNLDIFYSTNTLGKTAYFTESRKADVTICKSHVKPAAHLALRLLQEQP